MRQYILLGYPRSGNTWVRYLIELLYKTDTSGYPGDIGGKRNKKNDLNSPISYQSKLIKSNNDNNGYVWHTHLQDQDKFGSTLKGLPMIFVKRNPIEAVCRHWETYEFNKTWKDGIKEWFRTLDYYKEYNITHKVELTYETLLFNGKGFEGELKKLDNFFGMESDKTDLLDNFDSYKNDSINVYDTTSAPASKTKGTTTDAHRKRISKMALDNMKGHIKNKFNVNI
jgi:hypothetical protein